MNRREVLPAPILLGGVLLAGSKGTNVSEREKQTMPAIFLAHGAPPLLDDAAWMGELNAWATSLPRPKAVLMVSAHWEARPVSIGATTPVPLIYDFYGFPERYYRTKYPAPGAPGLATRVRALLEAASIPHADDPARGMDHGTYIPLLAMYPKADVPVLQVSLPSMDPKTVFAVGKALAPLRGEGVLIAGSGFLTHNLRAFGQPIEGWASDFDAWNADVLGRGEVDALLDYRAKAPGVDMALPTHEHYVPVILAAGAAGDDVKKAAFPITGWWMDNPFTKRSVQFG